MLFCCDFKLGIYIPGEVVNFPHGSLAGCHEWTWFSIHTWWQWMDTQLTNGLTNIIYLWCFLQGVFTDDLLILMGSYFIHGDDTLSLKTSFVQSGIKFLLSVVFLLSSHPCCSSSSWPQVSMPPLFINYVMLEIFVLDHLTSSVINIEAICGMFKCLSFLWWRVCPTNMCNSHCYQWLESIETLWTECAGPQAVITVY